MTASHKHEQQGQGHTQIEKEQAEAVLIRAENLLKSVVREATEAMDTIKHLLAKPSDPWAEEEGPGGRERHVLSGGLATVTKVTVRGITVYVARKGGGPDEVFFDTVENAKNYCERAFGGEREASSTGPWSEGGPGSDQ